MPPRPPVSQAPASLQDFKLEGVRFDYEPYPVGYSADVFPADVYADLLKHWPATSLFEFKPVLGNKYSLSEVNHPDNYHRFIAETPCWNVLHARIKSPAFVHYVIDLLKRHRLDMGLQGSKVEDQRSTGRRIAAALRYAAGRFPRKGLRSRFEFSMMTADGGNILPHTDSPRKLITLVLSMVGMGEWNDAWGGGTTVLKPIDRSRSFNFLNHQVPFDECETMHTYPFHPNQCVLFIKTYNSLHAVHPMTGPAGVMRRTLTINIEETT
jgi:hypothetical protein